MALEMTQKIAREFFDYEKFSGLVTVKRRDRKWFKCDGSCAAFYSRYSGKILKSKDKSGYLVTDVLGVRMPLHRLAWLYMTGEMPNDEIDHINGIRDDNSWANIRSVSGKENSKNISIRKDTPHGILGISLIKETGRWRAKIATEASRHTHLGVFSDWFEAVCCRKSAEIKYGYHKNHGKPLVKRRAV